MNKFEQLRENFLNNFNGNIREFITSYMVDSKGKFLSNSFSTVSLYEKYELCELKTIIFQSSTIESDKIRPHVFCIINNISYPLCPVCNSLLSGKHYRSDNGGRLLLFCSDVCRFTNKGKQIHLNKTKKTMLEKYGVDNIMKDKKWVNSTYLEKTKNIDWNKRNKKSISTNMKKRGVAYPLQSMEVKKKVIKTNNDRYGVDYVTSRKDIVSDQHKKNAWYRSLARPWNDNEQLLYLYDILGLSSVQISEMYGINYNTITKRLVKLGINIRGYAPHSISKGELEILEYVRSIYDGQIETNYKYWKHNNNGNKKWDLDIYLPELHLAIEHDGIYWHSTFRLEEAKAKLYQKRKHLLNGEFNTELNLINIFEDEWINNKSKIKEYLKSLICNNSKEILFARKLTLAFVPNKEANQFYNLHHLQSAPFNNSLFHYGLYNKDKLVSIMSFKTVTNNNVELTRYCTIAKVTGGFSKLLSYFQKNINIQYLENLL